MRAMTAVNVVPDTLHGCSDALHGIPMLQRTPMPCMHVHANKKTCTPIEKLRERLRYSYDTLIVIGGVLFTVLL